MFLKIVSLDDKRNSAECGLSELKRHTVCDMTDAHAFDTIAYIWTVTWQYELRAAKWEIEPASSARLVIVYYYTSYYSIVAIRHNIIGLRIIVKFSEKAVLLLRDRNLKIQSVTES